VTILRKWWVWPIIIVVIIAIVFTLLPGGSGRVEITRQTFVDHARSGSVHEIEVDGRDVEYKLDDDEPTFRFRLAEGETVDSVLRDGGLASDELPRIRTAEHSWWEVLPLLITGFLPVMVIAMVIVAVLIALLRWLWRKGSAVGRVFTVLPGGSGRVEITRQTFVDHARSDSVHEIEVDGRDVEYKLDDDEPTFRFRLAEGETVHSVLRDGGLASDELPRIRTAEHSWWEALPLLIIGFLPVMLIVAVLIALLRWLWRKGSAVGRVNG
jgi:ATP-dependent Zn protease